MDSMAEQVVGLLNDWGKKQPTAEEMAKFLTFRDIKRTAYNPNLFYFRDGSLCVLEDGTWRVVPESEIPF